MLQLGTVLSSVDASQFVPLGLVVSDHPLYIAMSMNWAISLCKEKQYHFIC